MSLVPIRVELPTYSHSFTVQVQAGATVLAIKEAISTNCTGQPHVQGQRLIWRGRYLNDNERISDLWKSPDEQRVVHLAVHHSAWSASPPTALDSPSPIPRLPSPTSLSRMSTPRPVPLTPFRTPDISRQSNIYPQPLHPTSAGDQPQGFIVFKHQTALSVLTNGAIPAPDRTHLEVSRLEVKLGLENTGYLWPRILDDEYPLPEQRQGNGLNYERVEIEGRRYLRLQNPDGQPTAPQVHALKTLTYTYPLLSSRFPSLPIHPTSSVIERVASPAHLNEFIQHTNEFLQRLNLPPVQIPRAGPQPNNAQNAPPPNVEANQLLNEIPVRALLVPLLMVAFRIILLLYFISPTRKPILGLCIIAWIMYEMWTHIRVVILRPGQNNNPVVPPQNRDDAFAPQGLGGQAGVQGANVNQGQPAAQNGPAPPSQATGLLDSLALTNIRDERHAIWAQGATMPEQPGFFHKITTLSTLLIATLHPAVWNRRRAALRQREGQLRMELNLIEREPEVRDGDNGDSSSALNLALRARVLEQHTRRPQWVREYVQRARDGEYTDD